MTELVYLTDSYRKKLKAMLLSCTKKGSVWEIILDKTIFYPQGGGQPADRGEIVGKHGIGHVKQVRMQQGEVIHECTIDGRITEDEKVECVLDWEWRYQNMRVHSAGHIVHEAVMVICPGLIPLKGEHGSTAYIEYQGSIPIDKKYLIERKANELVKQKLPIITKFVTLEELKQQASYIPEHLPKNKPLRIVKIGAYAATPDGGTQVKNTAEVGELNIDKIDNSSDCVRVYYSLPKSITRPAKDTLNSQNFISLLLELQQNVLAEIKASESNYDELYIKYLGRTSEFAKLIKKLSELISSDRQKAGVVVNEVKKSIEDAIKNISEEIMQSDTAEWVDVTAPGIRPPEGHLHIVTQAIIEITRIFEKIGFTRVRYPEVDWDWYPFESLNMPPDHPARDEWETFFIEPSAINHQPSASKNTKKSDKIVLTPHTSNGQVREMEKGKLPIRMINIAKCYRRQSDVSHVPMFHQFEGLYIDQNVSIGQLKGVFDFFVSHFYGPERKTRLRPFHFRFTEPSFEVDIVCGVCLGKARLPNGEYCRLCKSGWLELGGAGMVHPTVLRNGGIDPDKYNGFAFGWGVERTYMMKSETRLSDIRLIYGNDIRFLEQF